MTTTKTRKGAAPVAPPDHPGEAKVTFWASRAELEKFDAVLAEKGYKSRVEWFREQLRNVGGV